MNKGICHSAVHYLHGPIRYMKLVDKLAERSNKLCEICGSGDDVQVYEVPPQDNKTEDNCVMLCKKCRAQIEKKEELDGNHWKVLGNVMWSEVPGIQVIAWRMLNRLRNESWAADQLDMLYLDDEKLEWAKAMGDHETDASADIHKDAYGAILQNGDTVVLTKSLDVKGTSLHARVGTIVRNIRLVHDNTEQLEGRVEGQQIVILTNYVRKQNN